MKKINHKEIIDDLAGYLIFCVNNNINPEMVLFNLTHDIMGIAKKDVCFLPRTTGYKEHLEVFLEKEQIRKEE